MHTRHTPAANFKTITGRTLGLLAAVTTFALAVGASAGPAHAAPQADQNAGTYTDGFQDNVGIANVPETYGVRHDPFAQVVTVATDVSVGQFASLLVTPVSFDAWGRIYLDYTATQASDLEVYFQSAAGAFYPDDPANANDGTGFAIVTSDDSAWKGMVSLAGVPATVASGRVIIKLKERVVAVPNADPIKVKPVLSAYRVTWTPRSVVRLALEAPTTTCSNQTFTYRVRVAVSLVNAKNVLVYLPLELPAADPFGRNYALQFQGASNNGYLQTTATTIDGVAIPANSIVWKLGDVNAGHTFVVTANVAPPVGTLDTTNYRATASGRADNATMSSSTQVATATSSAPQPFIRKSSTGTFFINGKNYIDGNRTLGYNLYLGNWERPPQTCTEAYHETVIIDDVKDLVAPTEGGGFGSVFVGTPATAFTISDGGKFTATAITLANGASVPANSIYWDLGTLEVGHTRSLTYSLQLKPDVTQPQGVLPQDHRIDNTAKITSGFAPEEAVSPHQVFIDIPNTPNGIYAKGDKIRGSAGVSAAQDNWWLSVGYGEPITFLLAARNGGASQLDNTLMVDKVPDGTTFSSAFLPANASGTVYYNTGGAANGIGTPPGITVSTGALDASWTTTLPADPATVRWVAFKLPKLASPYFPSGSLPSQVTGEMTVTVNNPTNGCPLATITNRGLFQSYGYTGVGETQTTPITGINSWVENDELVDVKPVVPSFEFMQVYANPQVLQAAGDTTFTIYVPNQQSGGVETDTALDVVVDVVLPRLVINGVETQLPFVSVTAPGGSVDLAGLPTGTIKVRYASIAPLQTRNIDVRVNVPKGFLSGSSFNLTATAAGRDDVCGNISRIASRAVTVNGNPYLQVAKRTDLGVAAPGSELRFTLTYQNVGDAVSTQSWIVDRLPLGASFVGAAPVPGGGEVWFSDKLPPLLPTNLRDSNFDWNDATIRAQFRRGTTLPNGTIVAPTSIGAPIWIAFLIDNSAYTPAQYPSGASSTLHYHVRVDADVDGGANLRNEAAILSKELLPAISNETLTVVSFDPSIEVMRGCPDVVSAGEVFTWTVDYVNNSTNDDFDVILQETVPSFLTVTGATHAWNAVAQAKYGNVNVPVSINGTTVTAEVTKALAANGSVPLGSYEGGRVTYTGRVAANTASGTFADLGGLVAASDVTRELDISVFTGCRVLVENADLFVRKGVDQAAPVAGETITYTLIVSNEGANDAENVSIVDTLPSGLSYVAGTALVTTAGWGFAGSSEPQVSGATLTWSTLTNNAVRKANNSPGYFPGRSGDVTISFQAKVADTVAPASTLTNRVAVSTTSGEDPIKPNTASVDIRTPLPDPYIVKSGPTYAQPGQVITYRLRYGNDSRQASGPVLIVDKLFDAPAADGAVDVSYVGHVAANGEQVYFNAAPLTGAQPAFNPATPTANGWRTSATGGAVNWIAVYRANVPGNGGPYSIYVDVALKTPSTGLEPQPGAVIVNVASIGPTGPNPPADDDPTNNTSTVSTQTPGVDIGVDALCTPEGSFPGVVPGADVSLALELKNNGTVTAFGLKLGWASPTWFLRTGDDSAEVKVFTASGSQGNLVDETGAPITAQLAWTRNGNEFVLGSLSTTATRYYRKVGLPPGSRVVLTIDGVVAGDVANETAVTQAATATTDYRFDFDPATDETEEILVNNAATCGTTVYRADPLVIKSATTAGPFGASDRVTYEVAYNNIGAAPANDVMIEDYLPADSYWVVGSEVDVPLEGELEYDDGSGAWAYVPTGTTGEIDMNVRAIRVRFTAPVPAPAGATFSQDSDTDFATGTFANTRVLEGSDAVGIDAARGANTGTYLSPVIPSADAGNVLSWGRVVVEGSAVEGASVLVDVLDATSGEVLVAGLDPTDDNAWTLADVDPVAHPALRLRANLTGTGFQCDPHNDVVFELPSEKKVRPSAAAIGCIPTGTAFGVEFNGAGLSSGYRPVAWSLVDGEYVIEDLPMPDGYANSSTIAAFGLAGDALISNTNSEITFGWHREGGKWVVSSLPRFYAEAVDYESRLVVGQNWDYNTSWFFDAGTWTELPLNPPEGANNYIYGNYWVDQGRILSATYDLTISQWTATIWTLDGAAFEPTRLTSPDGRNAYPEDLSGSGNVALGRFSDGKGSIVWTETNGTWRAELLPGSGVAYATSLLDDNTAVGVSSDEAGMRTAVWTRSGDTWTYKVYGEGRLINSDRFLLDPDGKTFYASVQGATTTAIEVFERTATGFAHTIIDTPKDDYPLYTPASRLLISTNYSDEGQSSLAFDLRAGLDDISQYELVAPYPTTWVGGNQTSNGFEGSQLGFSGCGAVVGYSYDQGTYENARYDAVSWPIGEDSVQTVADILPVSIALINSSVLNHVDHDLAVGSSATEGDDFAASFWDLGGKDITPQYPEFAIQLIGIAPDGHTLVGVGSEDNNRTTPTAWLPQEDGTFERVDLAGPETNGGYVYDYGWYWRIQAPGAVWGYVQDLDGANRNAAWYYDADSPTGFAASRDLLDPGYVSSPVGFGGDDFTANQVTNTNVGFTSYWVFDTKPTPAIAERLLTPLGKEATSINDAGANGTLVGFFDGGNESTAVYYRDTEGWTSTSLPGSTGEGRLSNVAYHSTGHPLAAAWAGQTHLVWTPDGAGKWTQVELKAPTGYTKFSAFDGVWPQPTDVRDQSGFEFFGYVGGSAINIANEKLRVPVYQQQNQDGTWTPIALPALTEGATTDVFAVGQAIGGKGPVIYGRNYGPGEGDPMVGVAWTITNGTAEVHKLFTATKGTTLVGINTVTAPTEKWGSLLFFAAVNEFKEFQVHIAIPVEGGFDVQRTTSLDYFTLRQAMITPKSPWVAVMGGGREGQFGAQGIYGCGLGSGVSLDKWQVLFRGDKNPSFGYQLEVPDVCQQQMTNTATISTSSSQVTTANDSSTVSVPVQTTDLEVTLTSSPGTALTGDDITYTWTVRNKGTTLAENVELTLNIPDGSGNGGYSEVVTLGDLAGNTSESDSFYVTVTTEEYYVPLVGNAAVASDTIDCATGNDSASATSFSGNLPNVTVAIEAPETAPVGTTFPVTFVVTNNGNSTAITTELTATLPAGTTVGTVTVGEGEEGTCSVTGRVLTCTIPTLDSERQEGSPFYVTVDLSLAGCDAVGQTAVIAASVTTLLESNAADNSDLAETAIIAPAGRLELQAFAGRGTVETGDVFAYTIFYRNGGTGPVTGAVLTASIPAGTTLVTGSLTAGATVNGSTITFALPPLAASAQGALTFNATATAQVGATLSGSATIATTDGSACPAAATYDNVTVTAPGLHIVKQASAGIVCGQGIDWTITVVNTGTTAQTGLIVTDVLPATTPYVPGSIQGVGANAVGAPVLTWALGTLAPGRSLSLGYRTLAPASSGLVPVNVATLERGGTALTRTARVPVRSDCSHGGLQLDKGWTAACAQPGETVSIQLLAQNTGVAPLANVVVTDSLAPGLEFVPTTGFTYNATNRTVTAALGTVNGGQRRTLAYAVRIAAGLTPEVLLDTARIVADGAQPQASNQVTGVSISCNDGNVCTVDTCNPFAGCVNTLTPLEDVADDTCNGKDDDCDASTDEEFVPVDTTCGLGVCASEGQLICPAGASAPVDTCKAGAPSATTDVICDGRDEDCNGSVDEDYTSRTVECGDFCDGTAPTTCLQGEEIWDCRPLAANVVCDDGDLCSDASSCDGQGNCLARRYIACNDGNECTNDTCNPVLGCVANPVENGSECDDDNECTLADSCTNGVCGGNPLTCAAPDACQFDGVCNPATGVCDYEARPGSIPVPIGLTDLGTLGGKRSHANAINASDLVVGQAETQDGDDHAFAWTADGGMVDLTPGTGITSEATGVNASGLVVGTRSIGAASSVFSWTAAGGLATLFTGADPMVLAPRDTGRVAGMAGGKAWYSNNGRTAAVEITAPTGGSAMTPKAMNDGGVVVGRFTAADGNERGFWWTSASGAVDLATGTESDAVALNAAGETAGWSLVNGNRHAYVFRASGTHTDLGTLGGDESWAAAINDAGVVIGRSHNAAGELRAFAWSQASGMIDLGALPGGESDALFLAESGLAAGTSTSGFGTVQAMLWSIAEPPVQTALELLGASGATPIGVTEGGLVAGNLETGVGERAFVWESERGTEDLGTLGGNTARATALSESGRVVGASAVASGDDHAFVADLPETSCIVCEEDTTPPVLTCPVFRKAVECTAGGTVVELGNPSVSDACGRPVDVTDDAPASYDLGSTTVTYTATDSEDNASTCTTTVVVEDTQAPVITCPATRTVDAPDNVCGASVVLEATATDGCDGNEVTIIGPSGALSEPVVLGPGVTVVTLTAVDRAGNQATCETAVTVEGLDPLAILCDPELTVSAPVDFCGYPEALTAVVDDVCATDVTVTSSSDGFPIGVTDVYFDATNARGETASCTTKLTVVDDIAPTVDCGVSEILPAPPTVFAPTVSDICTATFTVSGAKCVAVDDQGNATELTEDCDILVQDGIAVAVREVPIFDASGALVPADRLEVRWVVTASDPSGNQAVVDCASKLDLSGRDRDGDGLPDVVDNCPDTVNFDQLDTDLDGIGDACDDTPYDGLQARGDGDSGCNGGTGTTLPLGLALAALLVLGRRATRRRA